MLRNPKYSIFFLHDDTKLYSRLKSLLKNKETIYPPALGMAQLLGKVRWGGEIDVDSVSSGTEIFTRSSFPVASVNVTPGTGKRYVIEKFARYLDARRQGYDFHRVMVEVSGEGLNGTLTDELGFSTPVSFQRGKDRETVFLW